ncbi:hypothetical protein D9M72_528900 [compost metagenome]
MQAHDDDDHAADARQEIHMLPEQHADRRGPCPKGHKDSCEPEREQQRRRQDRTPGASDRRRIAATKLVDRNARHVTKIGRHEWQDAGGKEREGAGKNGGPDGNIGDRQRQELRHAAFGPFLSRRIMMIPITFWRSLRHAPFLHKTRNFSVDRQETRVHMSAHFRRA